MKRKIISVLLITVMICSTTFFVKADQVEIRRTKSQGGVRSILLDPSHFMVNLNNNVVHVDFLFLLRDVNVSVVSSGGIQIYQQVVSSQTSSVNINLSGEESGAYTIYFIDEIGACLYGEFVIL